MNKTLLYIGGIVLLLAAACSTRQSRETEIKGLSDIGEKEVGDWRIKLKYLPAKMLKGDTGEYCFAITVHPKEPHKPIKADDPKFSFGTDSLFCIVSGTRPDTLLPVFTTRVANGKLTGLEYMVIFDKTAVSSSDGILRLLFKDWLFTGRNLLFTLPLPEIQKIDSLSLHI
jgi:hypothetical protein